MANKWAIQAGTFTDATIWNDGTLPQSGDTVYCNGYDVTISANLDLGNGTLTNGLNPDTNLSGGRFVLGANVIITANIEGYDYSNCVYGGVNNNTKKVLTLNGNVVSHTSTHVVLDIYRGSIINGNVTGGYSIYCYGYYIGDVCTLTINGNVEGNGIETIGFQRYGSAQPGNGSTNIVVNGNATNMMVNFSTANYYRNLTVSGNLTCYSALATGTTIKKLWVDGNFTYELPTPQRLVVEDFTIGGNIIYNLDFGIEYNTITYINVDNTDYISHSGTPFVIINNSGSTEFPLPQNVKKDIVYGGGNYVGTYQPEFPQEAVVLKDVTYDNGNYTGTLEPSNISQQLISRLENCATVETVQQLLVAHLDN